MPTRADHQLLHRAPAQRLVVDGHTSEGSRRAMVPTRVWGSAATSSRPAPRGGWVGCCRANQQPPATPSRTPAFWARAATQGGNSAKAADLKTPVHPHCQIFEAKTRGTKTQPSHWVCSIIIGCGRGRTAAWDERTAGNGTPPPPCVWSPSSASREKRLGYSIFRSHMHPAPQRSPHTHAHTDPPLDKNNNN
jgi:hypothetical protein